MRQSVDFEISALSPCCDLEHHRPQQIHELPVQLARIFASLERGVDQRKPAPGIAFCQGIRQLDHSLAARDPQQITHVVRGDRTIAIIDTLFPVGGQLIEQSQRIAHAAGGRATQQVSEQRTDPELLREIESLRKRLEVLERITTDERQTRSIAAEIESLRDK